MDYGLQVKFFGRNHRETFAEVKPHLIAKNAFCSRAGAVLFFGSVFKDVL